MRGAVPAAQRLTRGDKAAVDYDLDRHISAVGWIADFSDDLYGFLLPDDGAHHVAVERIAYREVVVLSGIDAVIGNGVVYRIFREFARQNDAAGGVGIAPVALVVVLVVRRGDVPALVQRAGVILVAGEVAALSYRALTIADLDECLCARHRPASSNRSRRSRRRSCRGG